MLHQFPRFFMLLVFLVSLGACARKIKPGEPSPQVQTSNTYYTQFSFFQEKGRFRTTNFRRGGLIPVNTQVSLLSMDTKRIMIRLDGGGPEITIENAHRHTGEDIQQAFRKILGKQKVDLSRFDKSEQENILNGQVERGMSRKAVLTAIGYPPPATTPSLAANDWTYWASRYDRFIVRFRDDKVVDIVD
jgi:hypothetical protein